MDVPFFRPSIDSSAIQEVVDTLESGWLTTGPKTRRFEMEFAKAVSAKHALAVSSCTAALHLAVEALGLQPGQGVLVPTMTFAATAEVVRYLGAVPILVDASPIDLNMDLEDASAKLRLAVAGELRAGDHAALNVSGMIPVHVGGLMMDVGAVQAFAHENQLWLVEDAAHAFPAGIRHEENAPWRRCGQGTADATCFSFYANKTITTGEGGMVVTERDDLAERMRLMCLHGLSSDAWKRYESCGSWDYQIVEAGYKYNMTDIAAAIGVHQLAAADDLQSRREALATRYSEAFAGVDGLELPAAAVNRQHSWHLYPIRLDLDRLTLDRNRFMELLREAGIGCSVHWRPLHLHPYYRDRFGWTPEDCPVATQEWQRLVSLPLYPSMTAEEHERVVAVVCDLLARHRR